MEVPVERVLEVFKGSKELNDQKSTLWNRGWSMKNPHEKIKPVGDAK